MRQDRFLVSRPDIKLHKDFAPVAGKNRGFLKGVCVTAEKTVKLARDILDKYNGRAFYDFDFSAFVFLERLAAEEKEQEEQKKTEENLKKSADIWNVYEQHMHLSNYYVTYELYHTYQTLVNHYGRYFPSFGAEGQDKARSGKKPAEKNHLYITTHQFTSMTRHLKNGNQILPGKDRLIRDFKRQMLVWQRMEQIYETQTAAGALDEKFLGETLRYSLVRQALPEQSRDIADHADARKDRSEDTRKLLTMDVIRLCEALIEETGEDAGNNEALLQLQKDPEKLELLDRVLEKQIKERIILKEIFEKVNTEITKHNFENFEEEKLCFLGVLGNYRNTQNSSSQRSSGQMAVPEITQGINKTNDPEVYNYENEWLEDLTYRVDHLTKEQWEVFKKENIKETQTLEHMEIFRKYIRTLLQEPGKISPGESLHRVIRDTDRIQIRQAIRSYEEILERHELVKDQLQKYETRIREEKTLDFAERKQILIRSLREVKAAYPRLFENDRQREDVPVTSLVEFMALANGAEVAYRTFPGGDAPMSQPSQILALSQTLAPPQMPPQTPETAVSQSIRFDRLTETDLRRMESFDRDQWENLTGNLYETYRILDPGEIVESREDPKEASGEAPANVMGMPQIQMAVPGDGKDKPQVKKDVLDNIRQSLTLLKSVEKLSSIIEDIQKLHIQKSDMENLYFSSDDMENTYDFLTDTETSDEEKEKRFPVNDRISVMASVPGLIQAFVSRDDEDDAAARIQEAVTMVWAHTPFGENDKQALTSGFPGQDFLKDPRIAMIRETVQEFVQSFQEMAEAMRPAQQWERQQVQIIHQVSREVRESLIREQELREQRPWHQWYFQVSQWQERRQAMARIYQETVNRFENGRQSAAPDRDAPEMSFEKGAGEAAGLRASEERNFFITQVEEYTRRYENIWDGKSFARLERFTLETDQGKKLMALFNIDPVTLEAPELEVFSPRGQERLRQLEPGQWNVFFRQIRERYGDVEKITQQKGHMEEIYYMVQALSQTEQPESFYQNMARNLSERQEGIKALKEYITLQDEGTVQMPSQQQFIREVENYIKDHPHIPQRIEGGEGRMTMANRGFLENTRSGQALLKSLGVENRVIENGVLDVFSSETLERIQDLDQDGWTEFYKLFTEQASVSPELSGSESPESPYRTLVRDLTLTVGREELKVLRDAVDLKAEDFNDPTALANRTAPATGGIPSQQQFVREVERYIKDHPDISLQGEESKGQMALETLEKVRNLDQDGWTEFYKLFTKQASVSPELSGSESPESPYRTLVRDLTLTVGREELKVLRDAVDLKAEDFNDPTALANRTAPATGGIPSQQQFVREVERYIKDHPDISPQGEESKEQMALETLEKVRDLDQDGWTEFYKLFTEQASVSPELSGSESPESPYRTLVRDLTLTVGREELKVLRDAVDLKAEDFNDPTALANRTAPATGGIPSQQQFVREVERYIKDHPDVSPQGEESKGQMALETLEKVRDLDQDGWTEFYKLFTEQASVSPELSGSESPESPYRTLVRDLTLAVGRAATEALGDKVNPQSEKILESKAKAKEQLSLRNYGDLKNVEALNDPAALTLPIVPETDPLLSRQQADTGTPLDAGRRIFTDFVYKYREILKDLNPALTLSQIVIREGQLLSRPDARQVLPLSRRDERRSLPSTEPEVGEIFTSPSMELQAASSGNRPPETKSLEKVRETIKILGERAEIMEKGIQARDPDPRMRIWEPGTLWRPITAGMGREDQAPDHGEPELIHSPEALELRQTVRENPREKEKLVQMIQKSQEDTKVQEQRHRETVERLRRIIEEQRTQVDQIIKEQTELKQIISIKRQEDEANSSAAPSSFQQMIGQLQNELRMEKIRKGML